MIIRGRHNEAKVMTENIEESAIERVHKMCNLDYLEGTNIVMMPDVHEGKGCAIGTTIKFELGKKVRISPSHIGVDIGCGMSMYPLGKLDNIDFEGLDKHIHKHISTYPRTEEEDINFWEMMTETDDESNLLKFFIGRAVTDVTNMNFKIPNVKKVASSIGTLGNGNHMIEIGKNSEEEYFLIVHTGSRYVGAEIAKHYQNLAIENHNKIDVQPIIAELKKQNKHQLIHPTIKYIQSLDIESQYEDDNCYLEGEDLDDYIEDQIVATFYATINRWLITSVILNFFGIKWDKTDQKDSPHNYIDDGMSTIVRKGACSARENEDVIIPINMRDGVIYGKGKGNKEWNYSAPHGAGRMLSRRKAKETLDMHEFKEQMKDVYSTTVVEDTLDEAPKAYKSMDDILNNIKETVDVVDIIKPVYNFKGIENKKWWEKK